MASQPVDSSDPSRPGVAIIGCASTMIRRETTRSLEEMIFDTSREALSSAGMTIEDIDSIVLSANDETDGRVISIMAHSGPSGSVGRDTTMTASAGDHALIYGYQRVLAGQGPRVLVVGSSKPSESVSPEHAELVEAEPFLLRQVGMNHTVAAALQASSLRGPDDPPPEGNIVAWPLRREDLPGRGDSVHAVVLAAEGSFEEGADLAWILDAGWATATYELGSRDLTEFDSLQAALAQIEKRSGQRPENWEVVEIGAASEQSVKAVADRLHVGDGARVNPSGGLADDITAPHVWGLGRMMKAIGAVREGAASAAGIGFHGFAGQGASVMVFAHEKEAA